MSDSNDELRAKLGSELARDAGKDRESARRDLADRIAWLRRALRGGPLTEGTRPTAEGHIVSALSALQRELEKL